MANSWAEVGVWFGWPPCQTREYLSNEQG